MFNWEKTASLLLALTMFCGLLTACSTEKAPTAGDQPEEEKHIEFTFADGTANTTTAITFDPAVDYTMSHAVTRGITETMFDFNSDMNVVPHLATGYEQLDELTWELTIRDGVSFSNGKALTAEMVKKSLEYTLSSNTRLGTLADVASIEADGQKLIIITNEVCPILPRVLAEPNTAIFDADDSGDMCKDLIGTGAYILESIDGEGNCELIRNENYWQGKPVAERIHTKGNVDSEAATLALQSGEIDWSNSIPSGNMALFKDNPDYQIFEYNKSRVYYLYINPNYTFTSDPAVREALMYAIDRDAIIQGVYTGYGFKTNSIFPRDSIFYDSSLQQVDYDLGKAKSILADAGYSDSDNDGFIEKDGQKLHLNITCYAKNQFDVLSEALQAMLKDLGIDSDIVVSDHVADDLMAGEYNIGTYGYNTLTLGDCYNYMYPVFHTGGTANFTGLSNPEIDGWLDEMKVTADTAKRAELAKKVQEKVYASNEYLFIMHVKNTTVAKANILNVEPLLGSDQGKCMSLWTFDKK